MSYNNISRSELIKIKNLLNKKGFDAKIENNKLSLQPIPDERKEEFKQIIDNTIGWLRVTRENERDYYAGDDINFDFVMKRYSYKEENKKSFLRYMVLNAENLITGGKREIPFIAYHRGDISDFINYEPRVCEKRRIKKNSEVFLKSLMMDDMGLEYRDLNKIFSGEKLYSPIMKKVDDDYATVHSEVIAQYLEVKTILTLTKEVSYGKSIEKLTAEFIDEYPMILMSEDDELKEYVNDKPKFVDTLIKKKTLKYYKVSLNGGKEYYVTMKTY